MHEPPSDVAPWPRLSSEAGEDLDICETRWDLMRNPRTGGTQRCLVLQVPDWVNIVAVTPEGLYVLVRQYRFGTEVVTTEIPGGAIDPGEDPLESAQRELLEETGYEAREWIDLGGVHPNPAFQDNRCHHFLARGAVRSREQNLDSGEDIAVFTLSERALIDAVRSGEVSHALVLTALSRVLDLRVATRRD